MKIKFNPGFEKQLETQILNSREWRHKEIVVNAAISSIRSSMAGRSETEVRAKLVQDLPFLTDPKNTALLSRLVGEISFKEETR